MYILVANIASDMATKETIGIGEFRQRATEIIREVEATARPVIIDRRGRPVVEIRALAAEEKSLIGSVEVMEGTDLTEPVIDPADWDTIG
jgi:antitoxin (DNA-binding transcriptional repressor) of toxin-antitoxin stability system